VCGARTHPRDDDDWYGLDGSKLQEEGYELQEAIAQPGDLVNIEDAQGNCEIYKISAARERVFFRENVSPGAEAYRIARWELDGGTVWIGNKDAREKIEPYRVKL
jgi:hypothetical protein